MAETVRITERAHRALKALAEERDQPMVRVLEEAIEHYRRHLFLQRANEAYARLRSDSEAWAEELEERRVWEGTLADDLDLDVEGEGKGEEEPA